MSGRHSEKGSSLFTETNECAAGRAVTLHGHEGYEQTCTLTYDSGAPTRSARVYYVAFGLYVESSAAEVEFEPLPSISTSDAA